MIFRRLFGSRELEPDASPSVSHYDTLEEGDRLIIEQLRNTGADLSKPREVLHYLYLPTREAFTALAATHGGEYDGWEAAGTP